MTRIDPEVISKLREEEAAAEKALTEKYGPMWPALAKADAPADTTALVEALKQAKLGR